MTDPHESGDSHLVDSAGATGAWESAAARLRNGLAARKGIDPAVVAGWRGAELASLLAVVTGRAARGALVRARLGRAEGLVLCGPRVRLYQPWHIRAGRELVLDEACEIVGLSRRGIVFGDRCTVGRFATIQPTNKLFDDPGEGLLMGDRSNIGPFGYVGCSGYIEIGSDVLMGPRVTLLAENHVFSDAARPIKQQGVERSFIRIEDDCWLGAGSVVLAGVTVGRGSVVAAGSVVTRDVPPFTVVAGAPAQVIRERRQGAAAEDEVADAADEVAAAGAARADEVAAAGAAAAEEVAAAGAAAAEEVAAAGAAAAEEAGPAGAPAQ